MNVTYPVFCGTLIQRHMYYIVAIESGKGGPLMSCHRTQFDGTMTALETLFGGTKSYHHT